jgi:hypothetical protein
MGKYDQQTHDVYTTLRRAGIPAAIDRDGDENLVTVPLPGSSYRHLEFDPTDDGCYRLDLVTGQPGDYPVTVNVVQSVGEEFAVPIVKGLMANDMPALTMTDGERVQYQHDEQGRILLVEPGTAIQALAPHTFATPLACMAVAMLNAAIRAGRATGGNSSYWIDDDQIYAQHGPNGPKQKLAVDGLSSEAAQALAYELHQAGQMGAYT